MKLLVIGGTQFVGKYIVEAAIKAGHEVTLFHRGKSCRSEDLPHVHHIIGDRESDDDLLRLAEENWDVVLDTSAYTPTTLHKSVKLLKNRVKQYAFISTISVYQDFAEPEITEQYALRQMPEKGFAELEAGTISWKEYYGELKVLCEKYLDEQMPGRVLHIRPCIVIGPDDYTDRLPYWIKMIGESTGEVLIPGRPEAPAQFVDARDLGIWATKMMANLQMGTYNACGDVFTRKEMFETIRQVTKSTANLVWIDEAFLKEAGYGKPSVELPLWIPDSLSSYLHIHEVSNAHAVKQGLVNRAFAESVKDIWEQLQKEPRNLSVGMPSRKMKELIEKFQDSK